MSVATVATRLARIQVNITGIVKAFDLDEIHNTLHTAQLPAFISVPGEATIVKYDDMLQETRQWFMLLYVCPIERPAQVAQRMSLVSPFFSRVRDAFSARDGLESLTGVLSSTYLGDSGTPAPLEFGGVLYAGAEFRLQTVEIASVTPVDYVQSG